MVNIWDYRNANKVKLVDISGKEWVGYVIDLTDQEEDEEATEDSITIRVDGDYIGFYESEITSIEVLY